MRAILSCIHANEEALRAVLEDIARFPVEDVYCLGDVLGYGPSPIECLDLVIGMPVVLLGNHDAGILLNESDDFPKYAGQALRLHDRLVSAADLATNTWYSNFLSQLRPSHRDADGLYVHASARNPLNEYVASEDVCNDEKMTRIGEMCPQVTFCGHTHVPGVFVEQTFGKWEYHHPPDTSFEWRLDGRKTIFNVGSVGQPRDGDSRAGYILQDGDVIRFRRVEYDVEDTVQKIIACPELNNTLGDRLREGW